MNRAEKRRQKKLVRKAAGKATPATGRQTQAIEDSLALAVEHHTAGRLAEAEGIYRQILQTDPDQPVALHLLGQAAHQAGRDETAVELIAKALAVEPDYAAAHSNLGIALQALGRLDEAAASYRKAIALEPGLAEAHYNLGLALQDLGRLDEAVVSYGEAIVLKPDYADALGNLGNTFQELGRLDEAAASCQKAIAVNPDDAETRYNLAIALQGLGRLDEAVASYGEAIVLRPGYADALGNLGNVLKDLGRLDEATASYREALALKPDFVGAGKNLLYLMLNVPGLTPRELFAEHSRFAETHARGIAPIAENFTNEAAPERRLRVGYLSSDFRDHAVGKNVFPLISSHDGAAFEVFCYADVRRPDAMTERFRACVDRWIPITGKSDAEVARMVRADGIDVLVCLAGRFDENRPLVCVHRAAPVQVSCYDGATSGLEEMDYWLTDGFLHPAGTKEIFTEALYRLPVLYQYPPIDAAPPAGPPPADKVGCVTFASFNNPAKVNGEVIRLWAEILKSVPGSRMLLKYRNWYGQASLQDRVVEGFAAGGIGRDRIVFAASSDSFPEHLDRYAEADIALDPFPFNGATTTFQALWMGVPVISLAGETFIGRMSGSLLCQVGLEDLAVDTPEAYVARARELAGDPARLKALRPDLRGRLVASPLCDAAAYARNMETAYRDMWRTWCRGGRG